VWLDFESPTALAFSLRPQSNTNLCLSRLVALEACVNTATQLWYDSQSVSSLLQTMPTQPDPKWPARDLDMWNAIEAEFPAMSTAMTTYRFQPPSPSRGQKQQTLPPVNSANIVGDSEMSGVRGADQRSAQREGNCAVDALYSELQPCQFMFANCTRKIDSKLPNVKVAYGFEFPSFVSRGIVSEAERLVRQRSLTQLNAAVAKLPPPKEQN
jgi:hypothetical protein